MLHLLNQMILQIYFSSTMFVQKSLKFSINVINLSYDICSAFQNKQHFIIVGNFLYAKIKSGE